MDLGNENFSFTVFSISIYTCFLKTNFLENCKCKQHNFHFFNHILVINMGFC